MVDSVRGSLRIRAWPKPRGQNRNATNKYWTEWLRQCMSLYKYAEPSEVQIWRDTVRGLPVKITDIYTAVMRGTMWTLVGPDGVTLYPQQAVQKMSSALDAIAQIPGSLLVRGESLWQGVPVVAESGLILITSDNPIPEWKSLQDAGIARASIGGIAERSTVQTIPNATSTTITFTTGTEQPASSGLWNPAQPTRLTAPTAGWYQLSSSIIWSAQIGGFRALNIFINGISYFPGSTTPTVTGQLVGANISTSTGWYLNANDYIETRVFHTFGSPTQVTTATMTLIRIG